MSAFSYWLSNYIFRIHIFCQLVQCHSEINSILAKPFVISLYVIQVMESALSLCESLAYPFWWLEEGDIQFEMSPDAGLTKRHWHSTWKLPMVCIVKLCLTQTQISLTLCLPRPFYLYWPSLHKFLSTLINMDGVFRSLTDSSWLNLLLSLFGFFWFTYKLFRNLYVKPVGVILANAMLFRNCVLIIRFQMKTWSIVCDLKFVIVAIELPYNDYFEYYGPDFKLHISPSNMSNQNTPEYLDKIKSRLYENLRMLPHAPSVQFAG